VECASAPDYLNVLRRKGIIYRPELSIQTKKVPYGRLIKKITTIELNVLYKKATFKVVKMKKLQWCVHAALDTRHQCFHAMLTSDLSQVMQGSQNVHSRRGPVSGC